MTGHVHDIVVATHDVNVTVRVLEATVPSKVIAVEVVPIGVEEAFMVAPDCRQRAWRQRRFHDYVTFVVWSELHAVVVKNSHVIAGHRQRN